MSFLGEREKPRNEDISIWGIEAWYIWWVERCFAEEEEEEEGGSSLVFFDNLIVWFGSYIYMSGLGIWGLKVWGFEDLRVKKSWGVDFWGRCRLEGRVIVVDWIMNWSASGSGIWGEWWDIYKKRDKSWRAKWNTT